jgi:nitroimidazol reductase NimA-like FMN-containing flavoprotein (pyridoxamine 5'-phosphate oxidase superfamily)
MELTAARKLFAPLPVANVATVSPDGAPHVVPLWFVWPEDALYVSARRPGRTWANATSEPRVSIAIDVGRSWVEVAGIVVHGRAEPLAPEHPSMRKPMSAWHEKYRSLLAGDGFARFTEEIHEMGFLRVVPGRVLTWDHAQA